MLKFLWSFFWRFALVFLGFVIYSFLFSIYCDPMDCFWDVTHWGDNVNDIWYTLSGIWYKDSVDINLLLLYILVITLSWSTINFFRMFIPHFFTKNENEKYNFKSSWFISKNNKFEYISILGFNVVYSVVAITNIITHLGVSHLSTGQVVTNFGILLFVFFTNYKIWKRSKIRKINLKDSIFQIGNKRIELSQLVPDSKRELFENDLDNQNIIYLHSPKGSGKTAIVNKLKEQYKDNVIHVSISEIANANNMNDLLYNKLINNDNTIMSWIDSFANSPIKFNKNKSNFSKIGNQIIIVEDLEKILDPFYNNGNYNIERINSFFSFFKLLEDYFELDDNRDYKPNVILFSNKKPLDFLSKNKDENDEWYYRFILDNLSDIKIFENNTYKFDIFKYNIFEVSKQKEFSFINNFSFLYEYGIDLNGIFSKSENIRFYKTLNKVNNINGLFSSLGPDKTYFNRQIERWRLHGWNIIIENIEIKPYRFNNDDKLIVIKLPNLELTVDNSKVNYYFRVKSNSQENELTLLRILNLFYCAKNFDLNNLSSSEKNRIWGVLNNRNEDFSEQSSYSIVELIENYREIVWTNTYMRYSNHSFSSKEFINFVENILMLSIYDNVYQNYDFNQSIISDFPEFYVKILFENNFAIRENQMVMNWDSYTNWLGLNQNSINFIYHAIESITTNNIHSPFANLRNNIVHKTFENIINKDIQLEIQNFIIDNDDIDDNILKSDEKYIIRFSILCIFYRQYKNLVNYDEKLCTSFLQIYFNIFKAEMDNKTKQK